MIQDSIYPKRLKQLWSSPDTSNNPSDNNSFFRRMLTYPLPASYPKRLQASKDYIWVFLEAHECILLCHQVNTM